jgi:carbonic anhydrase
VFVIFQVGAKNPELQKVVDLIPSISHYGEKAVVKEAIDPIKMLPSRCKQMSIFLFNLKAPCVLYIRTGVSLLSRERFLYI